MGKEIKASSFTEACGTILAKLCYTVADKIGESFAEKTSSWRRNNATSLLEHASQKFDAALVKDDEHASPRLVHNIIDEGSWIDDDDLQQMWAGLLVSSCSQGAADEGNLISINILRQLTSLQVKILAYACKNARIEISEAGWIWCSESLDVDLDKLVIITGVDDLQRLDRELDNMRGHELIQVGFYLTRALRTSRQLHWPYPCTRSVKDIGVI